MFCSCSKKFLSILTKCQNLHKPHVWPSSRKNLWDYRRCPHTFSPACWLFKIYFWWLLSYIYSTAFQRDINRSLQLQKNRKRKERKKKRKRKMNVSLHKLLYADECLWKHKRLKHFFKKAPHTHTKTLWDKSRVCVNGSLLPVSSFSFLPILTL